MHSLWGLLALSFFCLALLSAGVMFATKKTWAGPAASAAAILWYYVFRNIGSLVDWRAWIFGLLPAIMGAAAGYYLGRPVLAAALGNAERFPKENAPKAKAKDAQKS